MYRPFAPDLVYTIPVEDKDLRNLKIYLILDYLERRTHFMQNLPIPSGSSACRSYKEDKNVAASERKSYA